MLPRALALEFFWLDLHFLFTISHLRLVETSLLWALVSSPVYLFNYLWELSELKKNMYLVKLRHLFGNNRETILSGTFKVGSLGVWKCGPGTLQREEGQPTL